LLTFKIKTFGFGVPVRVFNHFKESVFDDGKVVSPGGIGHIHFGGSESLEEVKSNSEGSGS
jgi:hypothetical protein